MAISKEKQELLTEQRKNQILRAAMELIDKKGYRNTKISDIAESAGISKGLVYHYYSTKDDILLSVKDKLVECVEECASQEHAIDCLRLFIMRVASIPYYEGYIPPIRLIFSAVMQGDLDKSLLSDMLGVDFVDSFFGQIIRRGQEEGVFRQGDSARYGMIVWNWLKGCMVEINLNRNEPFIPDIDGLLDLLK